MQLFEHDCPVCNCRLRMRGPLRDRQEFDCPDCSIALLVRLNGGSCEVLIDDQVAPKPANRGTSSAPKVVAWLTAALLVVGFLAFLLTGPDESSNAKADDPIASVQEEIAKHEPALEEPIETQVTEPVVEDVAAVMSSDPEPEKNPEPPGEALIPAPPQEPIEPKPDPAEVERQREQERIAAAEREAISVVRQKLSLRLAKYKSADGMRLGAFFEELSTISGTSINVTSIAASTNNVVSVTLNDCTIKDILDSAADQAGLSYEVRADGVYLSEQ